MERNSELKKEYTYLKSEYDRLVDDYNELKSVHESTVRQLRATTSLMYASMAITTVFIATTIYFARRRPKGDVRGREARATLPAGRRGQAS
jgi:hypothetical protein